MYHTFPNRILPTASFLACRRLCGRSLPSHIWTNFATMPSLSHPALFSKRFVRHCEQHLCLLVRLLDCLSAICLSLSLFTVCYLSSSVLSYDASGILLRRDRVAGQSSVAGGAGLLRCITSRPPVGHTITLPRYTRHGTPV